LTDAVVRVAVLAPCTVFGATMPKSCPNCPGLDVYKRQTFFIEPSQLRALKDWSDQTMAPMGALIRRAIRESLVTHEKGEAK